MFRSPMLGSPEGASSGTNSARYPPLGFRRASRGTIAPRLTARGYFCPLISARGRGSGLEGSLRGFEGSLRGGGGSKAYKEG